MAEENLRGISKYYTTMPGGNKSSSSGPNSNFERKTKLDIANEAPIDKFMGNDPFAFSSLSYPLDLTNPGGGANGHYMVFYVNVRNKTKYIYNTPSGGFVGTIPAPKDRSDLYNKRTEIVPRTGVLGALNKIDFLNIIDDTKEKTVYDLNNSAVAGEARYKDFKSSSSLDDNSKDKLSLSSGEARKATGGMDSYLTTTTRISTSIALYLPPNVQDTLAAAYQGSATGMVGLALKNAVEGGKSFVQDDMEATASNIIDAGAGIGTKLAARSLAEIAETLGGGEGAEELINKSFGAASNPFMEVLFDQMSLRQFTYNFVFAPKSQEETDEVQKIIKLFRFHMAPELQERGGRFLTLPSTFDIHYLYQSGSVAKENDYYNKIATCVLENVQIDYTPGGVKSFADGAPTQITMGLTFKETELLTKDKIDKGF